MLEADRNTFDLKTFGAVYLAGIGGIGMSAIARYCRAMGMTVEGYDLTKTPLTQELESEGIKIIYQDDPTLISPEIKNTKTLVVRTPAVPDDLDILTFWNSIQAKVIRRSQMIGTIAAGHKLIAISGTHGKTTTTALTAHILNQQPQGVNAFIGGIAANYGTNLLLSEKSRLLVAEADEFDRAFLQFYPDIALISSIDSDHLDIYYSYQNILNAFEQFVGQIKENGKLIFKHSLKFAIPSHIESYTYDVGNSKASFYAKNIQPLNGCYNFDLITPHGEIKGLKTGVPGYHNLENSIAASALTLLAGIDTNSLEIGLKTFRGVKRRFEVLCSGKETYIDDYAHHPQEIESCINSARIIHPNKKITIIFQPHLYSRTQDLFSDFVAALSKADKTYLLPIYPAREKPIPGVTSQKLASKIPNSELLEPEKLTELIRTQHFEVLITMGAGNIGNFAETIQKIINARV